MEMHYTEKEKHIHKFLLGKGWVDEDIHKAMFFLTRWTTSLEMPIESYYAIIMGGCNYKRYKEEHMDNASPEEFLLFRRRRKGAGFLLILVLAFITLIIYVVLKGG